MRKEGLKKDGATRNGINDDQDADNSMANSDDRSLNGGDAEEEDPLDVTPALDGDDSRPSSRTSEVRSAGKTKGAKKVIEDVLADESSQTDEDKKNDCVMEKIVNHKTEGNRILFRVRWLNNSPSQDSWVSDTELDAADIEKYHNEGPEPDEPPVKAGKRAKKAKVETQEFEVEDIVGHRIYRKKNEYLIRWKGYQPDQDTWQKEAELTCPEILERYKAENEVKNIEAKPKKTAAQLKAARAEKEYEVHRILESKTIKGQVMYLVHWKNYAINRSTWEVESSLNCPAIIAKFLASQKTKTGRALKRGSTSKKLSYTESIETPAESESEDERIPAKKKRGSVAATADEDADSNQEEEVKNFVVEKIVDEKIEKNKKFYLVKWDGWTSAHNTWQSKSDLSCPDLIKEFEASRAKLAPKASQKAASTVAAKTPSKSPATVKGKTSATPKGKSPATPKGKSPASPKRKAPAKREINGTAKGARKTPKPAVTPKQPAAKKAAKTPKRGATTKTSMRRQFQTLVLDEQPPVEEEDEEEEDQMWEVDCITDVKFKDGSREFLIRWKGFDESQDTWEPESNLDCHTLIKKFMDKCLAQPKKKRGRK